MASVEIDSGDVLRLCLQFLQEQGLHKSLATLQEESSVVLNAIASPEAFTADVLAGRWDGVLATVATLKLPPRVLTSLYEQVVRELIEAREQDAARALLRGALPLVLLRGEDSAAYVRLETLASRAIYDASEVYAGGLSKEQRRAEIARAVLEHASSAPPARLLTLLGQALKWQSHVGALPPGARVDIFRGTTSGGGGSGARVEETLVCGIPGRTTLTFGAEAAPECVVFSPEGASLVVGCADGLIEVYDPTTGILRSDLPYQARDDFMLMEASVTAAVLSTDGELLATGARDGRIKVWRLSTGECVRRVLEAHGAGDGGAGGGGGGGGAVCALAFARDGATLLSGGADGVARMHGLRSGKALKEFRGHTSFVTAVAFLDAAVGSSGLAALTGSADGTVRLWDARTCECIGVMKPPQASATGDAPVLALLPIPPQRVGDSGAAFVVLTRAAQAHAMNSAGDLLRTFSLPQRAPTTHATTAKGERRSGASAANTSSLLEGALELTCACLSPTGKWLYAGAEDGRVYAWAVATGKLVGEGEEGFIAQQRAGVGGAGTGASEPGPSNAAHLLGIAHHPHRALLATWAGGVVRTWRGK